MSLYCKATEQIENELDIIKMLKHMRELKVISKSANLTVASEFLLDHQAINVLNIETGAEDAVSTCDEDENDVGEVEDYIQEQRIV